MSELGFGYGMRAVVYDSLGLFSAPRLWWTLRAFGCAESPILAGGLPNGSPKGARSKQRETPRPKAHFTAARSRPRRRRSE